MVTPTDAAIELTKEINQTFDPNPRVYYSDIKKTCAAAGGFSGRCDSDQVYSHDVVKAGETYDNLLDYLVFKRNDHLPNYSYCVAWNHLNCYFAHMFADIKPQYNEGGRVFFCVNIRSGLIVGDPGLIGHGNTLFYGVKQTRLIGDYPRILPNF